MQTFSSAAVRIVKTLVDHGYDAYIVGGAVRDALLNHKPKDYDITTNATPEEIRNVFGRRACHIIGRRFRLCHVYADGIPYEVSTFRRKPTQKERHNRPDDKGPMIWSDNEFGTMDDDVLRRDFTANALYFDPLANQVIDKCNGLADIQTRTVRAVGRAHIRFQEDPVRMLRAVKLIGQHGFTPATDVEHALLKYAPMLNLSSRARLIEEIFKILLSGKATQILEACRKYHLLQPLLAELDSMWDTPAGKDARHLLALHDASLEEDPGEPATREIPFLCMAFPYLREKMPVFFTADYNFSRENSLLCMQHIRGFLAEYKVPHVFTIDIRDMLMLVQHIFFDATPSPYPARHPLFPYALEFSRLLTMHLGCSLPISLRNIMHLLAKEDK